MDDNNINVKNFNDIYQLFKKNYDKYIKYTDLFDKLKDLIESNTINFSVINKLSLITIIIKYNKIRKLWINIYDNKTHIVYIHNIVNDDNEIIVSGSELLNFSIIISYLLNISTIELDDESSININNIKINLRFLNILSGGESWYNKFGFRSKNNNNTVLFNNRNSTKNNKFISNNFLRVYKELILEIPVNVIAILKYEKIIDSTADSINQLIEKTNKYIHTIINGKEEELKIKDVFKVIKKQLSNNIENEYLVIILFLINLFGNKIVYNAKLYKKLTKNNKNNKNNRITKNRTLKIEY